MATKKKTSETTEAEVSEFDPEVTSNAKALHEALKEFGKTESDESASRVQAAIQALVG